MLTLFEARFPAVPTTGLTAGVDLSGYQAASIWPSLGWVEWSCSKVTEGTSYTERLAIDHSQAAQSRGIPWGLYHFARFGDVNAEASRYLAGVQMVANTVGRQPAYHMLDLEAAAPGDVTAWSEQWCRLVETANPLPVIVYTGQGWANVYLRRPGTGLEKRPLWVANYANRGATGPAMPALWAPYDWVIWQWTSTPAGLGNLDVNVARPTFAALLGTPTTPKEEDMTPAQFLDVFGGGFTVTVYQEPDGVWRGYGAGQQPPAGSVVAKENVPVTVSWIVEAATELRVQSGQMDRLEATLARVEALLHNLPAAGPGGVPSGTAHVTGTLELRPAS